MKKINLEKGLFRIYIILTLCGLIFAGLAGVQHMKYLQASDSFVSLSNACAAPRRPMYQEAKEAASYVTCPPSHEGHDDFCSDFYSCNYCESLLGPYFSARETWINNEPIRSEMLHRILKERRGEKKKRENYVTLSVITAILPWMIHYLIKLLLLPLIRWVLSGFKENRTND